MICNCTENTSCQQYKDRGFFVSVFAASVMCYIDLLWPLKNFPGGDEKDGISLQGRKRL